MLAIISLISLYILLTNLKCAGIIGKTMIRKSKVKVANSVKTKAAMVVMLPIVLLVAFKVGLALSVMFIYKVLDIIGFITNIF